jgi:hypothetical protein
MLTKVPYKGFPAGIGDGVFMATGCVYPRCSRVDKPELPIACDRQDVTIHPWHFSQKQSQHDATKTSVSMASI